MGHAEEGVSVAAGTPYQEGDEKAPESALGQLASRMMMRRLQGRMGTRWENWLEVKMESLSICSLQKEVMWHFHVRHRLIRGPSH